MPQLGSSKSRTGCRRCKERRVKCDEAVPCGSCVRRKEHCSFLAGMSASRSQTSVEHASNTYNEDWMLDLELMHHYTTVLSVFGARDQVVDVWKDYISQQAFKHPFLMHGLLAFAALYLAHENPHRSSRYLAVCDKHQSIAVQEFRTILSSPINPELVEASFALATTLSLSSMGRSCALSDSGAMDMNAIAELFILTKGVANMIGLARDHIKRGPLKAMFVLHTYPLGTRVQLPIRVSSRFEALHQMLLSSGLDSEALKDCQHALTELVDIYKNVAYFAATSNIDTGMVSRWQVKVSMGYVTLIQGRSPPALIVLAYYAAAITAIHSAWYAENWAEYAISGISQSLEKDLHQWLQWPMLQIRDRMSELGVKPLVERANVSAPSRAAT